MNPGGSDQPADGSPVWMKYLGKAAGVTGGGGTGWTLFLHTKDSVTDQ